MHCFRCHLACFAGLPPSDSASLLARSDAESGLYLFQLWISQPSADLFHKPASTKDFASVGVPSSTRSMSLGTKPSFSWSQHQDREVVHKARAPLEARRHFTEACNLSSTFPHAIYAASSSLFWSSLSATYSTGRPIAWARNSGVRYSLIRVGWVD